MSLIVVDASITLAWCFADEQSPATLDVLERLNRGDQAAVPFFWSLEVLNSLLVGEKRGRISAAQTQAFLDLLSGRAPTIDYASMETINGTVQKLAVIMG